MKRKLQFGIALLTAIGIMASCSTSNEVAGNRSIQKRKYNKGFYFDFNKKFAGNANQEEIAESGAMELENNPVIEESSNERTLTKEVTFVEETAIEVNVDRPVVEQEESTVEGNIAQNTVVTIPEITEKSDLKRIKKELRSGAKNLKAEIKKVKKSSASKATDDEVILYYVLAFFIPFLAVGLVTDWDVGPVVINLLLLFLTCGIGAIIHAFVVVSRNT